MLEKYCGDEMKIDLMTGHNLAEANRSVTFTIIMLSLIIIRENKMISSLYNLSYIDIDKHK